MPSCLWIPAFIWELSESYSGLNVEVSPLVSGQPWGLGLCTWPSSYLIHVHSPLLAALFTSLSRPSPFGIITGIRQLHVCGPASGLSVLFCRLGCLVLCYYQGSLVPSKVRYCNTWSIPFCFDCFDYSGSFVFCCEFWNFSLLVKSAVKVLKKIALHMKIAFANKLVTVLILSASEHMIFCLLVSSALSS